jgi:hypothetical protein
MKTIRAGSPGSTEIIVVTNELEPSSISFGSNQSGDGLRVMRVRGSSTNLGRSWLRAYGKLSGMNLTPQSVTIDVSGSSSVVTTGRVPTIDTIIKMVNLILQGDDTFSITDVMKMVNAALTDTPMDMMHGDTDNMQSQLAYPVWYAVRGGTRYGVNRVFNTPSAVGLDDFFPNSFIARQPGCIDSGSSSDKWKIQCLDMIRWNDHVFVAAGSAFGNAAAVLVYDVDVKRGSKMALIGGVYDVYRYLFPLNYQRGGTVSASLVDVALAVVDGVIYIGVLAQLQQGSTDERFTNIFSLPVASYPAFCKSSQFVVGSDGVITFTVDLPIFKNVISGDEVCITRSGFSSYVSATGVFIVQSRVSDYQVRLTIKDNAAPFLGSPPATPRETFSSGYTYPPPNTDPSCYVAISRLLNPTRPRGNARRTNFFSGTPNAIDIADNQSGGLVIAHDSRDSFSLSFGSTSSRTSTYVFQASDQYSAGRRIRLVLPAGDSGITTSASEGKLLYLNKSTGLSLPGVPPGSSIRFVSGPASGTFMIRSRYQRSDGTTNRSYYVLGQANDLSDTSGGFSQDVEVEIELPVANALSSHVAANLSLKNGETITAMHVPFTWSKYPEKSNRVIYVGTSMGRIFRTINGGNSWDEVYSPLYGQNNRAGKNFPVLSIFCFHMDDPRDIAFSSIQRVGAPGSRQYILTASYSGSESPIYWWPYQAFELRIGSARLVCMRSELIQGKTGSFSTTGSQQTFNFIVSNESDTTALDNYVGQTGTFTFVPLPDVIATSKNGIVVRAHHYDRKNGFMVLSAPAQSGSNPAVPADFNVEDKDPDYGRNVMLDTSVDLIDQSWDVLGPLGSGSPPSTNNGGVYNSTNIAGCIVESGGTVRYVTGGSTHVKWPRLSFTNTNNEPISSVSVCRAKRRDLNSSGKVMIIFGGGGRFSGYVGSAQSNLKVSLTNLGIGFASGPAITDSTETVNVSLGSVASETVPGLNSGASITTTCGFYVMQLDNVQYALSFFVADSQGNIYACSPVSSGFEATSLKFNYVTSVPGSITAIDARIDNIGSSATIRLFVAGTARDGTPTVWLLTWDGSSPWPNTLSSGWPYAVKSTDSSQESVTSPQDFIQSTLPDVPTDIVATPRVLVAGQNRLMIARQGLLADVQLSKPCLLSLSNGSLLLAVVNETAQSVEIYSASAPGLVFSLVSSYKPTKISASSWADAPRPRLMETEFGEIILLFDNDIRVSVDGGRSWHTGLSDKIPLPISLKKPSDQNPSGPTPAIAPVFGTVGYLYKNNVSDQNAAVFRFARSMTDSAGDAVGCPAIPNKELLVGLKNLVISFSGEPQGGDRFSIDLDYANGASLLGAKSPSAALEVDVSSNDAVLIWDRLSSKYDNSERMWNVDAIGLFGTNFSKVDVYLSVPNSMLDIGSILWNYTTLHSFVMPDGSFASGYPNGYSIGGCTAYQNMIYVPSATLNHGVFRPGRRQYYVAVSAAVRATTYVARILDNTKNTLVVEYYGGGSPFNTNDTVSIKIFSDRIFSVLKNVNGYDFTKDVAGSYPYRFCRFVKVVVPKVDLENSKYVYGPKARIGVVAHGVATPYGNLTFRGESKHKFSRGFSYRERHFRTVRETETGQVSVVELSSKPRLELTLEYDDALWEDRDMTMASMLPALKKPVILVLDSNDPQSAEWVELAEEPVVKNTFADRYTWEVTWREVV